MGKSAHTATELQRIVAGDVVYDMSRHALRHGAAEAALTLTESKIMLHLLRNMGKPMSADDILLRALGISQLCRTTIVETNICRIRKKSAAIGAKTTIETVRYSGYVIE